MKFCVGSLIMLSAGIAQAATLTSDMVFVDINNGFVTGSGIVGPGTDITIGNALFDFDFGVNGDQFVFSSAGNFPEAVSAGSPLTIALTSLDFSGGALLTGFANLFSQFAGTTFTHTGNSILFSMTDGPVSAGVVLSGTFITTNIAAVPLPATLPMLLVALGGLAIARRKMT